MVVVSLYCYLKYSRKSTYYSSNKVAVVAPNKVVLMVIVSVLLFVYFCTIIYSIEGGVHIKVQTSLILSL